MARFSARSIWLQSLVCLAVIIGVLVGDITVASARVAADHKRAALRKLHHAEAAYTGQVEAISRELFTSVQPVQDALDHLDASRPQYLDAARDSVVNSRTSAAVTKLATRVNRLRAPRTLVTQHAGLQSALKHMVKDLTALERGKKSKDASDLLDEPYSGAAFSLSQDEDAWNTELVKLDTLTHRIAAPSPRPAGETRPSAKLSASKASWIFGADHACVVGSHSLFVLKDPSSTASLETVAKWEDRYAAIIAKVNADLRKVTSPTSDKRYLSGTVYRALHANDTLAASAHTAARGLRAQSMTLLDQAVRQEHVARKGLSSLSHDMTKYGAEYCGWFFNPSAKPSPKKSGGSGTISA